MEYEKNMMRLGEKDSSISPENQAVIENEKKHLQKVFLSLGKDRAKVLLGCKMIQRLRVTKEEFEDYLDGRPSKGSEKYLEVSNEDQNRDVYEKLCIIINLVEEKNNKPDAFRLWLNKKIEQIIARLNANNISKYDNETFGILLEAVYEG